MKKLPSHTFETIATFAVVESTRAKGKYSVRVTFGTGDQIHLSGPWDDAKTAAEHLAAIVAKRGLVK